jgi:hypothetical protein
MATFCYLNPKTKEIIDEDFPCGEAPESIKLKDGTVAERCMAAEFSGQGGTEASCWPMTSQALAVHPSQKAEYEKFAGEHGVPTTFDKRGRPVFNSRGHRKQYAELVGASDFDGGYNDPNCS